MCTFLEYCLVFMAHYYPLKTVKIRVTASRQNLVKSTTQDGHISFKLLPYPIGYISCDD